MVQQTTSVLPYAAKPQKRLKLLTGRASSRPRQTEVSLPELSTLPSLRTRSVCHDRDKEKFHTHTSGFEAHAKQVQQNPGNTSQPAGALPASVLYMTVGRREVARATSTEYAALRLPLHWRQGGHSRDVPACEAVPRPAREPSSILHDVPHDLAREQVRIRNPHRAASPVFRTRNRCREEVRVHSVDPVQVRLVERRACDDQAPRLEEHGEDGGGVDRTAAGGRVRGGGGRCRVRVGRRLVAVVVEHGMRAQ